MTSNQLKKANQDNWQDYTILMTFSDSKSDVENNQLENDQPECSFLWKLCKIQKNVEIADLIALTQVINLKIHKTLNSLTVFPNSKTIERWISVELIPLHSENTSYIF